jgi:hypothetical protein
MKKLLIATAIAASMVSGAHAATTYDVSSNITGVGLYLGDINMLDAEYEGGPAGYFTNFGFGGTAVDTNDDGVVDSSNLTLTGLVGINANGLNIRLTFGLNSGTYASGSGTTFTGGNILIDIQTTEGGFVNYGEVNAATTNLPFLAGQPGHWSAQAGNESQITTGLLLAPGTTALPGLWDQIANSGTFNNAVSALSLLGQDSGMFLAGDLTLTAQSTPEVPVPGAAWLFGSAVVGLAGASRKRKAAKA